jgi:Na+/melibiose symporter-like transporter
MTGKLWLSSRDISVPFFWGALSCTVSVISSFVWAFIDLFGYKKYLNSPKEKTNSEAEPLKETNESVASNEDEEDSGSHGGKIDFSMIKDLNDPVIIILIIILMLANQSYYLFTSMSTECLIKRFGLTLEEAKDRLFILPLLSTPMIPVYSGLVVKFGRKPLLMTIGFILCIGSYLFMTFLPSVEGTGDQQTNVSTKNLLYIAVVLLSQFNAIRGSLVYSCIALASPTISLPLAFGIALFSSNLMGAVMPNILGRVIKADTHDAF